MDIKEIAKVAHGVNKAYCESIGDGSQVSWGNAPNWQKESAINGVEFIRDNPEAAPSSSHESWLEEKREAGWKYGKIKDVDKKEHPCFVDYEDLPTEQKSKDYIFSAIVRELLFGEE